MPIENVGNHPENKAKLEKSTALQNYHDAQCQLDHEVLASLSNLPPDAVHYLTEHCRKPEHLPLAIRAAERLLTTSPEAFSDADLRTFALTDCVEKAAVDYQANEEQSANVEQKRETISKLRHQIKGKLSGADKAGQLSTLIGKVENSPDFSKAEREAALKHLHQIAGTLSEMKSVFTDDASRTAFSQILASSDFDLGAGSIAGTFAPVIAAVEASDQISAADKTRLREIVTGSDVKASLAETVIDENGVEHPKWTTDNKRSLRPGVDGFATSTGRQVIEARTGDQLITKDVTGWSGEAIGQLVEVMTFSAELEQHGLTGFMKSIYQLDFAIGDDGIDPQQTRQMQLLMGTILGGLEDSDGSIINAEERSGYLRYVARLLSKSGQATGFENDQAATDEVIRELNLKMPDGRPNFANMAKLGQFARRTYLSGDATYEDLKSDLRKPLD